VKILEVLCIKNTLDSFIIVNMSLPVVNSHGSSSTFFLVSFENAPHVSLSVSA